MNIAISNLVVQAPFPKCCAKSLIFIAYNFLYCYAINDILDKLVHLNIKHLLIMCLIHIHSTRAQSRLLEIVTKWWPTLNLTAHFKVEFASSITCCIFYDICIFSLIKNIVENDKRSVLWEKLYLLLVSQVATIIPSIQSYQS